MERYYFMRGELSHIQSQVLNIAMTPGINQGWARAYYRLADALNNLEAYIAYEESIGTQYNTPLSPLKDINPYEPDDLKYIADICVRHNAIISRTGEDICSTFYDEIRIAARILTFFNIRSCGGFKEELKNEGVVLSVDESSSILADSVEEMAKEIQRLKELVVYWKKQYSHEVSRANHAEEQCVKKED